MIVLVPAYEPDGRLLTLLDALREADPGLRLLVVDDGSAPRYRHLFQAARDRGCTVLVHDVNRGKGCALKTGFRYAASAWPGDDVVCADSDGQHSVVDVLRVAAQVRDGHALVLGSRRFSGQVPARSRLGNAATRMLFRLATGCRVQDTQTGLRGYGGGLLPWLLSVPGERFEYELNLLLHAARSGRPVREVDVATIYLEGNSSSHFRPLVDSARVYAPLLAFLLSSFGAFVVDLAALLVLHSLTGALLPSVVGARLLSGSLNFAVNRRLLPAAGSSRRTVGAAAVRYAALAAALLGANYAAISTLTGLGLALLPAKLLTEVALVAVGYQVQRRTVFATSTAGRPAPGGGLVLAAPGQPGQAHPGEAGRDAHAA